jgi:hypothetical protein
VLQDVLRGRVGIVAAADRGAVRRSPWWIFCARSEGAASSYSSRLNPQPRIRSGGLVWPEVVLWTGGNPWPTMAATLSTTLLAAFSFFKATSRYTHPSLSCPSMRAQSELLHLLTCAASFDPGRESRVLSSEMEMSGIVSRPPSG